MYECFGESTELAGASVINKAFALSVELISLGAHCDCMLLFEFGIEFSRASCQGSGREEMRDVGTGCVVRLDFVCV